MVRVSYYAKVTTAAATSSVLGAGTNSGFILSYTDAVDSVAQTVTLPMFSQGGIALTPSSGNTGNSTTTVVYGTAMVNAAPSAMTYSFGYTTVGTPSMKYLLQVKVEVL